MLSNFAISIVNVKYTLLHNIVTQFAISFGTWYGFGYAVRNFERIRYVGVYIVGTFGFVALQI
jgi:hypothetical protein